MAGGLASAPRPRGAAHVVGGRGFLGSAIVRALARAGWRVSASGREGTASDEGTASPDETLIWCAGERGGREGAPEALWHVHVEAACAAVSQRPALRALIYVSSGEVYGEQAVPFAEDAPLLGQSAYALAKRRGEDALTALCWQRGLALTIVRPSLIYGPAQAPAMLLPAALRALVAGAPFPTTAGAQTRDWIFVDDVAAAIAQIAARIAEPPAPEQGGLRIYNLASERERTVRSALTLAASLVGPGAVERIQWGALPYRPHETMRYVLSAARARRELDWAPRTSFEAGLAACVLAARRAS